MIMSLNLFKNFIEDLASYMQFLKTGNGRIKELIKVSFGYTP